MDKLTYKTFVWPTNPDHYKISYGRELIYEERVEGVPELTGVGKLHRLITGSGVFSGITAYEDFKKLIALVPDTTPGVLEHPVWGRLSVYFVGLELTQEPREDYVAYSFKFLDKPPGAYAPEE